MAISPDRERELVRMISAKISDWEWSSELADDLAQEVLHIVLSEMAVNDLR